MYFDEYLYHHLQRNKKYANIFLGGKERTLSGVIAPETILTS